MPGFDYNKPNENFIGLPKKDATDDIKVRLISRFMLGSELVVY